MTKQERARVPSSAHIFTALLFGVIAGALLVAPSLFTEYWAFIPWAFTITAGVGAISVGAAFVVGRIALAIMIRRNPAVSFWPAVTVATGTALLVSYAAMAAVRSLILVPSVGIYALTSFLVTWWLFSSSSKGQPLSSTPHSSQLSV